MILRHFSTLALSAWLNCWLGVQVIQVIQSVDNRVTSVQSLTPQSGDKATYLSNVALLSLVVVGWALCTVFPFSNYWAGDVATSMGAF